MREEVISDTSPLQYLHQLDLLDLLPTLYGSVVVPEAVVNELAAGRELGLSLPNPKQLAWVKIRTAPPRDLLPRAGDLGDGEREVLSLAIENAASLALLDDRLARFVAQQTGVVFTGTLGVLLRAKSSGHIILVRPLIDRLQDLGFRVDLSTREAVLDIAGER